MGQGAADDQLAALRQFDETWTMLHNLVQTGAMAPVVLPADERRYPKVLKEAQILYGRLANVLGRASMEHPAGGWFDAFQYVLGQPNISGIVRGLRVNLELWEKLWTLAASAIAQAIGGLEAQRQTAGQRGPEDGPRDEPPAAPSAVKGNILAADARGRLQEQLDRLEELAAGGRNPTLEELQEWAMWADTVVRHVYGEESAQTRDFGGVMSGPWPGPTVPSVRGYVQRLPKWRGLLRTWIREIDEFEMPSEAAERYIPPRSQFDAYVALKGIMETAAGSLVVVDPYVDDSSLQLLLAVSAAVNIRVLTVAPSKDFAHALERFRQQWGGTVEARVGPKELHDRFLLIDDRVFFSGASFKDLGRRGSFMAEIRTEAIKQAVKKDIDAWWVAAQPIA